LEELELVRPSVEYENEYLAFYQEWKQSGEDMIPWVISKEPSNFQEMLQSLWDAEKGENLPDGWVPDSTFWLVGENKTVLGAVNIRHSLTEMLFNSGGHIGYGIRPTERRKGYATQLLSLSLKKAKDLGIEKALVVCDSTNIASKRTILNNGGMQVEDFVEEDGNIVNRFWIELK
jgi:predicted acetyltransferase